MKPRLRHLLAAAFIFIATVPLLILGSWVQKTAMEKELAAVSEKHLLLAQNITAALDRYALDTKAAFAFFAQSAGPDRPSAATDELARSLGFRQFSIIDDEGRVSFRLNLGEEIGDRLPAPTLNRLRPAFDNPDVTFSNVMPDAKGQPTIFLTHRLGPGRIAIGALDLGYIRQVQKAIAFGRKGHSAIVDGAGTLIAHPRPQWQRQMKNIAKVKPVAKMMAGETGVTQFYSPAVKKDMITGFTTVPSTGWGVMVPQPLEELEERANDVRRIALALVVFGLLVATVLSWLLSGLLVRPVEAVIKTARDIADGNLESRVPHPSRFAPTEFLKLGTVFNAMARDVATVMIQRQRVEKELRQAHDELETRVEERTRALTEEIAEREQAEKLLERQKTLFEAVFRDVPDAMVLTDTDRAILMCNPGFTRTFGYEADEVLGQKTETLYESREEFERQGRLRFNLSAVEKLEPYVVNYKRQDGEVFPGETVGTAIRDKDGTTLGFIGVIRDITERQRAEKRQQGRNEVLEL
ncbi:MAG: PAS domain S-box protein, partial [Proteobacteria bacterium]|nr:PAS domain S-box protein [Pseudomonadota bacterium]